MIHFLHIAGTLLDAPFEGVSADKSACLRLENRRSLTGVFQKIRENGIDLLFITGNFFDFENLSTDTIDFALRTLRSIPSCRVFLLAGSTDPCRSAIWKSVVFPENVTLVTSENPVRYDFQIKNTPVTVLACADPKHDVETQDFEEKLTLDDLGKLCILVGSHPDTDKSSIDCPIALELVATPKRGEAILGRIEGENGKYTVESGALCKPLVNYEEISLPVGENESADEILSRYAEKTKDSPFNKHTILKLILTGEVATDYRVPVKAVYDRIAGDVLELEIVDRTLPLADAEKFADQDNLLGILYKKLLPDLRSGNTEKAIAAREILREALKAQKETEVFHVY